MFASVEFAAWRVSLSSVFQANINSTKRQVGEVWPKREISTHESRASLTRKARKIAASKISHPRHTVGRSLILWHVQIRTSMTDVWTVPEVHMARLRAYGCS